MLHNVSFPSWAVFIGFLLSVVSVSRCSQPIQQESVLRMHPVPPVYDGCRDFTFNWQGRELTPGRKIGQGAFGKVYELKSGDQVMSDAVLKIIPHYDANQVKTLVDQELALAKDFPGIYTTTTLRQIFEMKDPSGGKIYAGFLIKKRINGYLLADLANGRIVDQTLNYRVILSSFLDFRKQIIDKLTELGQRQIYVWDFHNQNVMYDLLEKRWYLIDAERESLSSWDEVQEKFFDLDMRSANGSPNQKLFDLVTQYSDGIPTDSTGFFQKWVDIYFERYVKNLQVLAEQSGSKN